MSQAFEEPDEVGGTRLNPKELVNHLLLVWPVDYIPHSPTKYSRPDKPSDVIVVDVVDLDAPGGPVLAPKSWWRQAKLIQALKPKIGRIKPMLCYMAKEPESPGTQAAYILVSASSDPQCVQRGMQWLTDNPWFKPSESFPQAAQAQPPVQQPRPQPVAPPREETMLERMARQAQQGVAALGTHPLPPPAPSTFTDEPPF